MPVVAGRLVNNVMSSGAASDDIDISIGSEYTVLVVPLHEVTKYMIWS